MLAVISELWSLIYQVIKATIRQKAFLKLRQLKVNNQSKWEVKYDICTKRLYQQQIPTINLWVTTILQLSDKITETVVIMGENNSKVRKLVLLRIHHYIQYASVLRVSKLDENMNMYLIIVDILVHTVTNRQPHAVHNESPSHAMQHTII